MRDVITKGTSVTYRGNDQRLSKGYTYTVRSFGENSGLILEAYPTATFPLSDFELASKVVSKAIVEEKKTNKYVREIAPNVFVDVYDVIVAFGVICPARAHAVKKLLCTGIRGHKDSVTDIKEAIQALERSLELSN